MQLYVSRLRQAVSLVALVAEQAAWLGLEMEKNTISRIIRETKTKKNRTTYLNVLHESPALSAPREGPAALGQG